MYSKDYFQFNLYGNDWGELDKKGKYVFQNRDEKIGLHSSLPFLVFHFVTNYDLSDLELFFRLAGFSAFTEEELPDSIVTPRSINLSNKENVHGGMFGGFTDEERAKKCIESELGEGIISEFQKLKIARLLQQRDQLLEESKEFDPIIKK